MASNRIPISITLNAFLDFQVNVQCVEGCSQSPGFERLIARDVVTRSTFASVGDIGLRFFNFAAPPG